MMCQGDSNMRKEVEKLLKSFKLLFLFVLCNLCKLGVVSREVAGKIWVHVSCAKRLGAREIINI